ncbi:5917_t:CDS:2 [Racocetra fulgida]|uniref:5917_t:CDS:1 n=1 Tax=Racocetra fulgida TaxID=60492 RepID=A0A9N8W5X4_9GLOM|nr:5917_t:CDS:2 [Racocetra fulgida]
MTLTRISRNEIPDVRLSKIDYERYKSKFPGSLKQGVTFSNQSKIHGQLRNIRGENNFTNEIIDNISEITIDVDNDSLTDTSDSVSETYTSDGLDCCELIDCSSSDNERLITNKIAEVQTAPINNSGLQPVATKSKKCSNDRQIENYALKSELSTLKTQYIDLEKEITNLKEKNAASNERKTFLELQGTEFKYTIKTLEDTIKGFEATIKDLGNNELNLKAQHKELLKELTLSRSVNKYNKRITKKGKRIKK